MVDVDFVVEVAVLDAKMWWWCRFENGWQPFCPVPPASPAHVATLVRAPFALRKGQTSP